MPNIKPPLVDKSASTKDKFEAFEQLVQILRRECPWDKEQTNKSISHLLIEEAYETTDAIDNEDYNELKKELGDLLLHIVMHSVIASETNKFKLEDVIEYVHYKMINRHPHVFGETEVENVGQVMQNWEQLKKKEGKKSVLEGVPNGLPALLKAERIQHKASRVGFDWDNKEAVWEKVEEEIGELKNELLLGKSNKERINEEFGDVLFALVNAARFEDIVPEDALQTTNRKFIRRFQYIEQQAKSQSKDISELTLQEMDNYWNEAKANI
jgi:XTP/dITP diphosphohydrolase